MIDWPDFTTHVGDCREKLQSFAAESFSSCVTDPPYGISFMGAGWDHGVPDVSHWLEVYRVLKPGAHLAAFSSPRMGHRMTAAIEDAGFEVRDALLWLFGQGFPKGLDIAKAIDKRRHDRDDVLEVCRWIREQRDAVGITNADIDTAFGFNGMAGHWTSAGTQPAVPTLEQVPGLLTVLRVAEAEVPPRVRELLVELNGNKGEFGAAWHAREITGEVEEWEDRQNYALTSRDGLRRDRAHSPDAQRWEGWSTALKPAYELIVLARKPLPNGWTVADCVLEYGTGAINIQACRIETGGGSSTGDRGRGGESSASARYADRGGTNFAMQPGPRGGDERGRWPANVVCDEVAADMIDVAASDVGGHSSVPGDAPSKLARTAYNQRDRVEFLSYDDGGGASRFYYCAKATREERDAGLEGWKKKPLNWSSGDANPGSFQSPGTDRSAANFHPTVKPLALMRWLCRLITPPGGRIIEPFMGSGSTICGAMLEGFAADGIDLDPDYVAISQARATHWRGEAIRLAEGGARPPAAAEITQADLFA